MKTIYISGPITDLKTGQPREGWEDDFLKAEIKLRKMGFEPINPKHIASFVDHRFSLLPNGKKPTRVDYIIACLERMNTKHQEHRLHGIFVLGDIDAVRSSYGVQMELLLAEVLDVPIYSDLFDGRRIDRNFIPMQGNIDELLAVKR